MAIPTMSSVRGWGKRKRVMARETYGPFSFFAMNGRHPRESEAMIAELMMPQHANIMGNVFGGVILSMVDRVAAVAAIRHARRQCVTVSVDKVDFREPIKVGELVTAMARVNFTGRTSMEIGVKVMAEN